GLPTAADQCGSSKGPSGHRQVGREQAWWGPAWSGKRAGGRPRDPIYAGHRYPAEIISYADWLYFRFPLSLRMVEEMLAARGISVTPRRSGNGASNSAGNSPAASIGERLSVATSGTSMRSSSASPGRSI